MNGHRQAASRLNDEAAGKFDEAAGNQDNDRLSNRRIHRFLFWRH
jgi:hypothetical protein